MSIFATRKWTRPRFRLDLEVPLAVICRKSQPLAGQARRREQFREHAMPVRRFLPQLAAGHLIDIRHVPQVRPDVRPKPASRGETA